METKYIYVATVITKRPKGFIQDFLVGVGKMMCAKLYLPRLSQEMFEIHMLWSCFWGPENKS